MRFPVYTKLYTRQWKDYEEVFCNTIWPSDQDASISGSSRKLYHVLLCVLLYAIPMVVMTCAYTAIIVKLRAKNSEITELNNNLQKNKHSSRRRVSLSYSIGTRSNSMSDYVGGQSTDTIN